MADRRNPWPRLPKWLQKFVRMSSRKHDEMSSFRLYDGFRLQENKEGHQTLETTSEKAISSCVNHVTKYSTITGVLQQPWPGVSPIRYFERGEGSGDEVDLRRGSLANR